MEHGYGNYWDAIDGDARQTVSELLPKIIEHGKVCGTGEFDRKGKNGKVHREKTFGIHFGDTPLGFFVLLGTETATAQPSNQVEAFYPLCIGGITHRLKIEKITPWENGIEGVIEAETTQGAMVWFFDPYFFKNKDVYRVGESYNISLGALAVQLGVPTQNEFEIDKGPMIDLERERVLKEDPNADVSKITSVKVSMEGCAYYMPGEHYPDEAGYRGVADEIGYFELEGRGVYRIKTVIMRPDEVPFAIYLYVTESVLKDYRPKVGDNLEGTIWLQGFLQE